MKIGVFGCTGRMGKEHIKEILQRPDVQLAGAVTQPGDPLVGQDAAVTIGLPPCNINITDYAEELFENADAVIDFSTPEASVEGAKLAAKYKRTLVIGTTGFTDSQLKEIKTCAKETVIIQSSNMSIGVNLLFALTQQVAKILDTDYDIEIVEMHHRHKVDAPSGTALSLGEAAAKGRHVSLNEVGKRKRDGQVGPRPKGEIGFATLRGGDVVGDHTVIFAGEGERIELTHKASNRSIYAKGAVRACLWSKQQQPGFYSMQDVLIGQQNG